MKEIYFKSGKILIVDDIYYDYVARQKMYLVPPPKTNNRSFRYTTYCAVRFSQKKRYLLHRLIYSFAFPDKDILNSALVVHHKNGNGLDNRIENLALVSHSHNASVTKKTVHSKSGIRGVYPENGKWIGRITFYKKRFYIGSFKTKEEAAEKVAAFLKEKGLPHTFI